MACPSPPRGGHGRDTDPWDRSCAAWSTRSQHICSDSCPGLCGFWKKSDHCGNLSLKFNILLSVRMQSFWEIQPWQLKIKQPCGNSETSSSAPMHPNQPGVLKVQLYLAQMRSIVHRRTVLEATWKCIPAEQYHPQHLPAVDVELQ